VATGTIPTYGIKPGDICSLFLNTRPALLYKRGGVQLRLLTRRRNLAEPRSPKDVSEGYLCVLLSYTGNKRTLQNPVSSEKKIDHWQNSRLHSLNVVFCGQVQLD
jgi:hypothetical protein